MTLEQLLCGVSWSAIPPAHKANLMVLLNRINLIEAARAEPMTVTNSYRTMAHHLEIYAKKGITDPAKIPMKSAHLVGKAVDIYDPAKELQEWCSTSESTLRNIGVWMENFEATPNWVHFQTNPYGSFKDGGSLWFKP